MGRNIKVNGHGIRIRTDSRSNPEFKIGGRQYVNKKMCPTVRA
jgi:hypothetical protein